MIHFNTDVRRNVNHSSSARMLDTQSSTYCPLSSVHIWKFGNTQFYTIPYILIQMYIRGTLHDYVQEYI